jgi:hypothetical protein
MMPNWSKPENLRLLRELTYYYMLRQSDGQGMNISDLLRAMADHLPEEMREGVEATSGTKPKAYHALARFLHFETWQPQPENTEVHEALFRHVLGWFRKNWDTSKLKLTKFRTKIIAYKWLAESLEPEPQTPSHTDTPVAEVPPIAAYAPLILGMAEQYLKLDIAGSTREASRRLTKREKCAGDEPTRNEWQGFETYRYSTKPGRVVKTFTVFAPPSANRPFCTFYNAYKNEDGSTSKNSSGIVLSFELGIYCIGRLHDLEDTTTDGLEILVLPKQTWQEPMLHGLVLTRDDDAKIIVARAALKRTEAKTSEECGPTVIPFEEAVKIDINVLKRIRNTIGFEIGRLIRCSELGRSVTAQEMVDVVQKLCSERFMIGHHPFNPAAHEHYPFNQALHCYSLTEPFRPWMTKSSSE